MVNSNDFKEETSPRNDPLLACEGISSCQPSAKRVRRKKKPVSKIQLNKEVTLLNYLASGEQWTVLLVVAVFLNMSMRNTLRTLQVMEERGLLRSEQMKTWSNKNGVKIWGVTAKGLKVASERHPRAKPFKIGRTPLSTIDHHIILQKIRRRIDDHIYYTEYTPSKVMTGTGYGKVPDATYRDNRGVIRAVELELFVKSKKRMAQIVADQTDGFSNGRFDCVDYYVRTREDVESLSSMLDDLIDSRFLRNRYNVFSLDDFLTW